MVREYIGARYVPKFMGTYDQTTEYEALCVVDNGQGTSYITKVPTPAGTPLTDTTYWAIYGSTSGAIIALQNAVNNILATYVKQNTLVVFCEDIGVLVDNTGADNSTAINDWIDLHSSESYTILFGAGEYHFTDGIKVTSGASFIGNSNYTKLIFEAGSHSCFYLPSEVSNPSIAYDYYGNVFANIIVSNFENNIANRTAFDMGLENDVNLINVHQLIFNKVRINYFNKGFYLEGYGHAFYDCDVRHCNIAYDFVHPEQVTAINCWSNYCDVGVRANVAKTGFYGSVFRWIGGALQRGRVGCEIRQLRTVSIETYFEQNTQEDIILGNKANPNSDDGVQSVNIFCHASSANRTADYYSVAAYWGKIITCNIVDSSSNYNYIYTNGSTENVVVYKDQHDGTITFDGNSAYKSHVIYDDQLQYLNGTNHERILRTFGNFVTEKTEYAHTRAGLDYILEHARFGVFGDATSNFTVKMNDNIKFFVDNNAVEIDNNEIKMIGSGSNETASISLVNSNNEGATIRFNPTTNKLQIYYGSAWHNITVDG